MMTINVRWKAILIIPFVLLGCGKVQSGDLDDSKGAKELVLEWDKVEEAVAFRILRKISASSQNGSQFSKDSLKVELNSPQARKLEKKIEFKPNSDQLIFFQGANCFAVAAIDSKGKESKPSAESCVP
jgi:hypothetical protein